MSLSQTIHRKSVFAWLALAARRAPRRYWLPLGLLLGLGFLLLWAELAVGVFTGVGS